MMKKLFVGILALALATTLCAGAALAQGNRGEKQAQGRARQSSWAGFAADGVRDGTGKGGARLASSADALLEAGVIDQETADAIAAYAQESCVWAGIEIEGLADMTLSQLKALLEENGVSLETVYGGNVGRRGCGVACVWADDAALSALTEAGVIDAETANAITAYAQTQNQYSCIARMTVAQLLQALESDAAAAETVADANGN